MEQLIDLKTKFLENICSFDIAKKAKKAGIVCSATYFAYDRDGNLTDAGWMEDIGGSEFYPVINLPLACHMIDNTIVVTKDIHCYQTENKFVLKYLKEKYESDNLVDLLVEFWLKYKNKKAV